MTITDTDVHHYVDDGFLVVPGLVCGTDVDACRREVERFAAGEYPVTNPVDVAPDATPDALLRSILAVHFPHRSSRVARDMLTHPGIASVVERLCGAHLPHWDGRVKCMQSMLFAKPPGYPGQAWHQDERFIPTWDRSLIGAWICLDDADEENGCLWVVPGSHRMGCLYPTRPHGQSGVFDSGDEAYGFDDVTETAVPVAAGDVIFFNGYLLHRSLPNRSNRFRRALVNHYMNAWSLLPWGAVPADQSVATFDNRAVVPVVGDDPYVAWRPLDPDTVESFLRPAVDLPARITESPIHTPFLDAVFGDGRPARRRPDR